MGRNGSQQHTHQIIAQLLRPLFGPAWLSFVLLSGATAAHAAEQLLDRLMAEVNGEAITFSEVDTKVKKGPLVEVSPYPSSENDAPEKVALNDMINKTLIMQKADEQDIEVTDASLNEEIDRWLRRRDMTKDALLEALKQEGVDFEQYKEDFRAQMVISIFQGRELQSQLKITDRDIQLYYLRNSGSMAENVRLTLRQLSIDVPAAAVDSIKEGKKQLVEKVYQELEGGMAFEQAVKIYSDNASARESGGLMPKVYLKDLAPVFQSAVKDLEEGRYSRPIDSPNGYFIFYVAKKEFTGSEDYQKQKSQLEAALRQEEMGKLLTKWLEAQRRRSNIKVHEGV